MMLHNLLQKTSFFDKTVSKKAIQKPAETTGDLIGNFITE